MSDDKPVPRILQQQPPRKSDSQQQQQRSGAADFQPPAKPQGAPSGKVEGEGSYSATRNYQRDIKEYLDEADVAADAAAAKPRSESEAQELENAEREGLSHSKGER